MTVPFPQVDTGPLDPALLAQLANAFFSAPPGGATTPPGVQAPSQWAPPGSPLASPAGFGPSVPGTPIPQGQLPGTNLLPASPAQLPSLAHRAPALLPQSVAGNGVPDKLATALPAYEPRLGGIALGVPQGQEAARPAAVAAAPASPAYYFLDGAHGHPLPGGAVAGNALGHTDISDALVRQSFAPLAVSTPAVAPPTPPAPPNPSAEPRFYFVDAVVLPSGFVTPPKAAPHDTFQPAGPQAGAGAPTVAPASHPPFDVHAVRRDFPILQERVNGRQLVWFDNAATTHKPQAVIDRVSHFYEHENSNIHRAAHALAARATDAYEGARERVKQFINAPDVNEVIFVRGTTEAINLVAKSWGAQHVGKDDEIIVSHLEHHANIVPWQQLAASKGARLRVIPVDDSGQVLLDEYRKLLNDRTRIVAVTQVSNALGTVVPVKDIIELAHRAGALALVDGAQSVSHMRVDVQALGADFFVFSGHKVFGPHRHRRGLGQARGAGGHAAVAGRRQHDCRRHLREDGVPAHPQQVRGRHRQHRRRRGPGRRHRLRHPHRHRQHRALRARPAGLRHAAARRRPRRAADRHGGRQGQRDVLRAEGLHHR